MNIMKKYALLFLMFLCTAGVFAQKQLLITGIVTDHNGEPLIGASVTIKDKSGLGVITDLNGKYKIEAQLYQTLVFSYIGFDNQEVLLKGNKRIVNIKLLESKKSTLDEVIVTGMGARKKLTVTGAITNVNMDDLKHYSTSNLSNALAGNVPGILAMQSSGQPGKNTSEFWIRGISTFGASNKAYILVDGFERDNIDDINIEDIQSFTILKDASATAIYGSKGANGVILITTKHGQAGKIRIDGKLESSYNTRTITPEFVDGVAYANLANEACRTRDTGIMYTPEEIALIQNGLDPDIYPNVDWKKLLLKNGAGSCRANINLSGGSEISRYFASISYTDDQGMYKTDETLKKQYNTNADYNRWNYRLNLDINVTKSTLLQLGIAGNLNKRNSPGLGDNDVWGELFGYNALYTPVMYSNGYIPASNYARDQDNHLNPWVASTQTGYNQNWDNNIQTNVTLQQDFNQWIKGLKFIGRFGYDTYNSNWINHHRWPKMYFANGRDASGQIVWDKIRNEQDMTQTSGGNGSRREFLDFLLSWNRTFFKNHNFGMNVKYTQDSNIQTQNIGGDIKNSINHRNQDLAGQFTYNYALRYFFDYNFGYNGSENFAKHHRYGFFPACSFAWNIGEESFVKKNLPWENMIKVRYSHGKVGNDNVGTRFPYLSTISGGADGYNWGSAQVVHSFSGTHFTQVASPNVTWEVSTKDDIGLDLVLFKSCFSLTFDYYNEKRTGIYMVRNFLPEIVGLESTPSANVGAVKLRGFDGNFSYNKKFGPFDVTLRGNITYSKNKVLDEDEENKVYPYQYLEGYRVNQQRGLISLGLFKDYDDIRHSPKQSWGIVQPGDIKYKDVNGDGVVDNGDKVAIGATSTPNLIYGLGASIKYGNFDFNVHFQGAGKTTFPIYGKCVFAFSESQWGNIIKGMLDNRWISHEISGMYETENPNAKYPRLSYGGNSNNQQNSTFWLRDGRYLRLKNLDVGYTLPKIWTNALHITNLRIYVTGQNLITWSKFKMWDPETIDSRGEVYPLAKSVTVGFTLSF